MTLRLVAAMLAIGVPIVVSAGERVAVLEIEVENSVVYRYDVDNPTQVAANSNPTPTTLNKAFTDFCQIGDVKAVNGKPAKGLHMTCGTRMGFSPTAGPGFAIADVTMGSGRQECNWELYSKDGKSVGRFVDGGFFPHAIQGGAGAYFGATGEHESQSLTAARVASVSEDPSRRRVNGGGGSYKAIHYVVPKFWPEIETAPAGPTVLHSNGWSLVTPANPARPGESLVIRARNLGPTTPSVRPGQSFPTWPENPLAVVNADVEVTVGGKEAEVFNQVGWPGESGVYFVEFRMPSGVTPGMVKLQLTSAWIPSNPVEIAVQ